MHSIKIHVIKKLILISITGLVIYSCGITKRSFEVSSKSLDNLPEDYLVKNDTAQHFAVTEPIAQWWEGFNDATLDTLIKDARKENFDINAAIANFQASRAGLKSTKFDRFPTVDANGSFTRQRLGQNIFASGINPTFSQYNSSFDAFWEIDLFGRVKNRIKGAKGAEQASLAEMQNIYLSVFAEVARNYMELRGIQNQLTIAKENLSSQQETFELTNRLAKAGTSNSLDVSRAKAQLETTRATIPPLRAAINAIINRLSVLTGKLPGVLEENLMKEQSLPSLPESILVGDGIELIKRRPDIFKVESELVQQIARYNISVAELYPKITFGGTIGFSAIDFNSFGKNESFTWGIAPSINWAAFNLGRVKKNIDQQDAFTIALINQYEKTVLLALEEIKTAMGNYTHELERQQMLIDAAEASKQAAKFARQRYEAGLDDFLDYLNAEQTLLTAQNQLAISETLSATNLIAIYKALGGGWEVVSAEEVEARYSNLKESDANVSKKKE